MPPVLDDHDVFREDWVIFVNDLFYAWSGRLPVIDLKSANPALQDRVRAAIDLVDNWNEKFFLAREVEIVLCMEDRKKPSLRISGFTLYLTNPHSAKGVRSEGRELSRSKLAPATPWANCIPGHIGKVVPLTGRYAQRDQLRNIAVANASAELLSTTTMGDSEMAGGRLRVNSM